MKIIIKKFVSLIYTLLLRVKFKNVIIKKTLFIFSKVLSSRDNVLELFNAKVINSKILLDGIGNYVQIKGLISKSTIEVHGENNKIFFENNTELHDSSIVLRGDNCKIIVGNGTTFGGVMMVCMGKFNSIIIGEKCMFSNEIDIWATDSHPIFDVSGKVLNYSKPISIGNHVWVGKKCTILKGVTIGDESIIGMAAVVTHDIKSNSINVGNPSRCIKQNIYSWKREYIDE